eukprot:TRINITY_DN11421_c0_g1_i1.p1 TRINITY_DN11421_c0_g1~~TRINITY_DN11421_c0_g1_i1.p1  ORF type:complete len:221 (-),score=17.83 TRINITY_DN11421_c0_g1_i1:27-689(-)
MTFPNRSSYQVYRRRRVLNRVTTKKTDTTEEKTKILVENLLTLKKQNIQTQFNLDNLVNLREAVTQHNLFNRLFKHIHDKICHSLTTSQRKEVSPIDFPEKLSLVNLLFMTNSRYRKNDVTELKLELLMERYSVEYNKLRTLCDENCKQIAQIMKGTTRQDTIVKLKSGSIQHYFISLNNNLAQACKANVMEIINAPKEPSTGKRSFNDKASKILWTCRV